MYKLYIIIRVKNTEKNILVNKQCKQVTKNNNNKRKYKHIINLIEIDLR